VTVALPAQERVLGWDVRRLRTSDAAKAGGFPGWTVKAIPRQDGARSLHLDDADGRARGVVYLGRRVLVDADAPPALVFSYTSFCALPHRSGNVGLAIFDPTTWDRLGRAIDTELCEGDRTLRPRWSYPLHGMAAADVIEPVPVGEKAIALMRQAARTYAGQNVVLAVTWMGAHTSVERASFHSLRVVRGKPENAMEVLLDRLDLDAPELAAVKQQRTAGDVPGAVDALVAHFRERWPEPPATPGITRGSLQECDQALENRFRSIGSNKFYKLGEDFEWSRNAIDDQEWLLHFQWHHWLKALVEAGQLKHDPRYTRKAIELIRDWIPKNYPGARWSWRTLEVSLRAMNWPVVYRYLLHSPDFTRADHVAFLNTLAEHADYLLPVERFHSGHNFGATESKALLTMGMTFPEFANAKTWRQTAWHRFEGEITDQVLDDGAQKELTTGYHNGVLTTFLTVARMVEGTDMHPSKLYWDRLEKMHDYTLFLTKPDGSQPDLGDSWRGRQGKILTRGADVFHRPDMLFVGSDGKEGTRPDYLDTQLPETGYFVMRTSWTDEPDGLYLCFDAARHWGGWHQHYDALGIILYAHGRTLTPDAGPFAYGSPLRDTFQGTAFHSTVTVDEGNQNTSPCRVHAVRMVPGLSFADAEQTGYEGVTHRRQILFARPGRGCAGYFLIVDRVTGEGEHTVDAHFHLPPGPARKSANGIRTDFPKGGNLLLQGLGEGELSLETSWIMTGYGEKTDRPDVRFRQHGRLPAVFVTLLVPYRSSATPGFQARLLAPAQATGPIAVEVSNGGRRDVLFAAPDVQPMSLPSFSGQGRAGLVRLDGAGKTILQAVVGEH
jgi:heparan-sulfate lyase